MKYFFVTLYLFLDIVPKLIFADNIYDYSNLNLGKKIPREDIAFTLQQATVQAEADSAARRDADAGKRRRGR